MRTAALAASFLLAFAAAASAVPEGTVEIGVSDLVDGMGERTPRKAVDLPWPSPSGGGFAVPAEEGLDAPRRPVLEESELARAVAALQEGGELECHADGGRLFVPAAGEPGARRALARIRARRAPSVDVEYALEAGGGPAWKVLLSGREPVLAGDRGVFVDARDRPYLSDFDVEIAQDAQVPDPVQRVQRTGVGLLVRVLPLPRGDAAAVEAIAVVAEPVAKGRADTGYGEMAPLDRAAVACDQARAVFRAEPGRESVHEWTGRDGTPLRLRLTARWAPLPPDEGPGAVVSSLLFVQSLCNRRFVGYRMEPAGKEVDETWAPFGQAEQEPSVRTDPSEILRRLGADREAGVEASSESGVLVLSGKDAGALREGLCAEVDGRIRPAHVEVAAFDVAAGAADATGGRPLFRAAGPVLLGVGACWSSGEGRAYIADQDVEVAQGAFIPDPILEVLITGAFANVRLLAGPEGRPAMADLDFQLARLDGVEATRVPILVPVNRTGGSPSGAPAGRPERSSYVLEEPAVREVRIATTVPLAADGTAVLRRAAPGFLGEGREVLLLLSAR
jgi:hypothetical protein